MSQFQQLVQARRSANKFKMDVAISEQELHDMFSLVKFAPSAFNLQHARYVAVTDKELKDKIYEAAHKQYKVKTSSAVIAVLGDLEAYRNVGPINEGLLNLGVMDQREFDDTVNDVTRMYEEGGDSFKRDEAIRNASLSAMLFMLIAKDKGWDTCPMIGFDPERLKQALNIPDRYVPVMLIAVGKEDTEKQRPRGYRKPVGEFASFNGL
ncbi:nitroreductase family protein [Paenibacillus sp. JTLBN-2024]|jgi:putative NAD(P)H nitroreductase|uniref:NAD(P)H nitroreductase MhqN n=1 Tax=Paenibacillus cookii TaxID=157839 RepID=A0ABQ4M1F6_9BACL|nr:nitroreductase family protein [Paenibacillus cookii]KHF37271.1 putative NAD(P)H nitroreductase MhqN [Paenibacillus sp. P1XP2]GIO68776.1 putative NAD(P)H nitroreductase MhqN [Paenibacillus cookii]HWO54288.1 nitroreductase family protein [Paenibacillus cookii]